MRGLVRAGSPRTAALAQLGVECVEGDLKAPESLRAACRGARAVLSTANSAISRRKGDSIRTVDLHGHLHLVAAAHAEGVSRFVYTSVTPSLSPASPFVRAKREVEEAVRGSGMDWTILQGSAFMEISFSKIAGWSLDSGIVTLFGDGLMPVSYVSVRDVAAVAVLTLERQDLACRALPVGGPEPVSARGAVRAFEDALGRPLRVRHVPIPVARALAVILTPFDPIAPSLITMAMETAMRGDVLDTRAILGDSPITWTTVRDYARRVAEGAR